MSIRRAIRRRPPARHPAAGFHGRGGRSLAAFVVAGAAALFGTPPALRAAGPAEGRPASPAAAPIAGTEAGLPDSGEGERQAAAGRPRPAARRPLLLLAQGGGAPVLPSLVLPPAASGEPPQFAAMMRTGDSAMVRGDVLRARAFYERAAALHPTSASAALAAGKTFDPNVLGAFGGGAFADAARAREWYERARALGDPAAPALLASLR